MDVLAKTINSLSKKEIINYKIQASRAIKSKSRKDIALFDIYRNAKKDDVNSDKTKLKLYSGDVSNNTYNKLKERLLHDINNSLIQFYFHETDANYIYSELSLYKIFIARNEYDVAYYHLQRAEKKALLIQDFLLLDVIYSEFIVLSTFYGTTKPEEYLKKRAKNHKSLTELRLLDEALTIVIHELDRNQSFGQSNAQTIKELDTAIKRFEKQKEFKDNVAFKRKLFEAMSQLLISKKDFKTLEKYTIRTFNEFLSKKYFTKSNHDVKLQMIRYTCNSLFMNGKHQEALDYAKTFYNAIKEHQKFLYDKNIFFYYNALANNYSILSPPKVISVLNEAKKNQSILNHPSHLGYIYFNLAGAYFELNQPKIALKNILGIINHSVFLGLSNAFKIQILIFEILLRLELRDLTYSSKQISFLLKTYSTSLLETEHHNDALFLKLLHVLISKNQFTLNKQSLKLVDAFYKKMEASKTLSILDYSKWLKDHLK